jgi:hypothetical protein
VVLFSTVNVSSVQMPLELAVTAKVCPAGAERMEVALDPPQFVQTVPEKLQPPWMETPEASDTTSWYVPAST